MRTILETRRLILRELCPNDFHEVCKLLQDNEVMYAYEGAFNGTEVREWLDRQIKRYAEDKVGLWGAVLKENGELIGQCGITMQPYREQTVPEIGYLIRMNFWHNGYATEAARSCADYASHILGIKRIYSIIRDNNLPSQGVAKRIGMTPGDTIVKHYRGIDMPHIVFSMTLGELTNFGGITRSIRCSEANETSRNKQLDEPKVSKVRDRAFLPEPQTL